MTTSQSKAAGPTCPEHRKVKKYWQHSSKSYSFSKAGNMRQPGGFQEPQLNKYQTSFLLVWKWIQLWKQSEPNIHLCNFFCISLTMLPVFFQCNSKCFCSAHITLHSLHISSHWRALGPLYPSPSATRKAVRTFHSQAPCCPLTCWEPIIRECHELLSSSFSCRGHGHSCVTSLLQPQRSALCRAFLWNHLFLASL